MRQQYSLTGFYGLGDVARQNQIGISTFDGNQLAIVIVVIEIVIQISLAIDTYV